MAFLRVGDMFRADFDPDTDGRINLTAMPDGASGQVLTAQGAGVDPVYAEPKASEGERALIYAGL